MPILYAPADIFNFQQVAAIHKTRLCRHAPVRKLKYIAGVVSHMTANFRWGCSGVNGGETGSGGGFAVHPLTVVVKWRRATLLACTGKNAPPPANLPSRTAASRV